MWFALVFTVIIGALLYKLFFAPQKNFWKKYGVRQVDTSVAVTVLEIILGRKSMSDADDYAYAQLGPSEKYCGILENGVPMLLVKDMDLLKRILIKDFDHFVDRRQFFNRQDGTLSQMLPSLQGEEWKGVRASVSPTFTTGKIRKMMDYFNSVGLEWVAEFTRKAKSNSDGSVVINVLRSVNQYTVEVISSSVFGMRTDAIKNPDSTFNVMANRVADFSSFRAIAKFAFRLQFPSISKKLGFSPIDKPALTFFEQILEQGLKSRISGETEKRNDFLQLLIAAKKGELEAVENDELNAFEKDAQIKLQGGESKKQWLTDEVMNAQSVLFFFAGFSTTSNLISFALYALALNQDVQDKLRKEINKIVKKDGSLDYDDIGQLLYMDMVMNETLRKFPGAGRLERVCVRDYKDDETGLVIPKGAVVNIPVNAIHHDKEHYEKPDEFYPEHFSPEKKAVRNPYAFLSFGLGPRNCIGMRFAQIEVKSVIAHIVHGFLIEPTAKTPLPLRGQPVAFQLMPPKELELKLTPVNIKH